MLSFRHRRLRFSVLVPLVLALAACGGDGVDDEASARDAYLGLDLAVDRAMNLGMAGFNAASNANIPAQTASGSKSGTMTVAGKVDQGASNNKTMNLTVALAGYDDGSFEEDEDTAYDTDPAALPTLDMKLSKIPNGTFSGALAGRFRMQGKLEGEVVLDLTMSGAIRAVGESTALERVPGATTVSGTAESSYGIYDVAFIR